MRAVTTRHPALYQSKTRPGGRACLSLVLGRRNKKHFNSWREKVEKVSRRPGLLVTHRTTRVTDKRVRSDGHYRLVIGQRSVFFHFGNYC